MLKLGLCDQSDAYILVGGTITVPNTGTATVPNNIKNIRIKNCAPLTDCISEINNPQIDNAKKIDVLMPIYNLIKYVVTTQFILNLMLTKNIKGFVG